MDPKDDKGLKIIVVGLPRTGTMSMKAALEELGYGPCHHLLEPACQIVRLRKSAAILGLRATAQRQQALRSLYEGYEVCIDVPGSACVDDLLAMYPNAKIILTTRKDASSWLLSYNVIFTPLASRAWRILGWWVPGVLSCSDMVLAWNRIYETRFPGTAAPSCKLYHQHTEWVRRITPAVDFLDFEVGSGWAPLCKFLEKPIPDGPFPRRNERNYLVNVNRLAWICGVVSWVFLLWAMWYCGAQILDLAAARPFYIVVAGIQLLLIAALIQQRKALRVTCLILVGSLLYNAFATLEATFSENRITCAVVFSCLCVQFLRACDLFLLNPPAHPPIDTFDAFNKLWNMRDIGLPRQIRSVPPFKERKSTRPSFLLRRAAIFSVAYLLLEVIVDAPPAEPATSLTELVLIRVLSTAAFYIVIALYLSLVYSALAIVQVALYISDPEDWPPLWGHIIDMWSVRRWWGMTWHQTLRNTFNSHARVVSAALGFRPKSLIARYFPLVIVFGLSGLLHFIADRIIGVPWHESGAMHFFLSQVPAVVVEDFFQSVNKKFNLISGKAAQLVGYLWVATVLVLTTHLFMDPTGRYVRPGKDMMLPAKLLFIKT